MLARLFLIGFGGFLGTLFRYGISEGVQRLSGQRLFPLGLFIVNIFGCLILGVLAELALRRGGWTENIQAFLFIGLLSAITSFSAYTLDTTKLIQNEELTLAFINASGQAVLGLAAAVAGIWLIRWVS